jgi:pimeloyl-ACP methyl ester carboxylesterase
MWDGFDLPGEVRRHQLPADLAETVRGDRVSLVGNSYGGFVALDFAARHPELVEKLVLLDAPLMDHDFSPEFMDYVEEEQRLSRPAISTAPWSWISPSGAPASPTGCARWRPRLCCWRTPSCRTRR